eukprot:CAMPEP_0113878726 /NCGR_PEP_ID=MMETSP0780_2-20120614/6846_1 /TAXON_ID=652834 /ORGANISM="Palpitomonas bilix" /LENGTH=270 /DNA_ID=CAMNT_0000865235 /DNA_START=344 /DNA_END=1153 /DNA_ORIENTATION=+ /assembly_acc=CAM_ASM_000599
MPDIVLPAHVRQVTTSHLEQLREITRVPHPSFGQRRALENIATVSPLMARLALVFGEMSLYRSIMECVSEVTPDLLKNEKQRFPELWTADRTLSPILQKALQEHVEMMRAFSLRLSFFETLASKQEMEIPEWLDLLPRYINPLEGERHVDLEQTECPIAFKTFEPGETTIVCKTCLCQFSVESLFRWYMQNAQPPPSWRLVLTPYDERMGGAPCPNCRTCKFGNFAKSTFAVPLRESETVAAKQRRKRGSGMQACFPKTLFCRLDVVCVW